MNQIDDFVLEEQQSQTTFITWTEMTQEKIAIRRPRRALLHRLTRPEPPSAIGGPPPDPGAAAPAPNLCRHHQVVRGDAAQQPEGSPRGRSHHARR